MLCEMYIMCLETYLIIVLILVLMEDALRELNLRRADCQLIIVLFLENPLDFRGKSVPDRQQMYEISRCLHRVTHYTE